MSYIASPLISKIIKQENLSFNEKAITSKKFGFQVQDSNEVIFLDDRIDMCGFVEEREYTSISGSPAIIPQTYLYSKYSTTYGSFAQFGIAPMASALSNQSFTIAKSFDAGENRYQKNYTGQNVCVGPWGFYGHYYSGFTLKELNNGFLVGKYDVAISPINDIDKKTSCNYCFVNVGINDVEYYEPIDIVNGVINFHKNIGEIGKKTFGSTLLQYSSGYANNSTRDKIIETNKLLESGFLKNNIKFFKMHEYQELINSGAYSGFAHQSSTSNGYLPSPKTALDIASGLSNFLKENIPSYEYSIPSAFSDSWVTRNPFIVSTKTGIYKTIDSGAYQYYTSNDFSGFFSGKSELIAGDIFYGDFDGACNGLYSGSIISGSIQTKDSNFTSGFFRSYSGSFYGFTGNNGLFSTGIDSGIYSGNFTGSFIGYATGTFSFFNGSGDANYYGNFKSGFLRSFSIYDGKTTGSFFSGMVDNGSGYFNGYNEYLLRTGCSFSEVKENNLFR